MTGMTALRLAAAGTRTDLLRVALTALGVALTAFVLLSAATVWWVPATEVITQFDDGYSVDTSGWRYTSSLLNETRLRPWLAAALVILTIPPLVFAAQSARLGAPARDRRLAAIRLAGATPGQARLVVTAETVLAGVLGALVGIAVYMVVRQVAHDPVLLDPWTGIALDPLGVQGEPVRRLPLPTDAPPPGWVFLLVAAIAPLGAATLSLVALRRVTVNPLAVVRRVARRRLRWWPLIVLAVGIALVPVHMAVNRYGIGDQRVTLPATAWTAIVLMAAGLALCGAPLGQLSARLAHGTAHRPAPLLAARRILADPWSGGRSTAVVLVATGIAAAALTGWTVLRTQDVSDGVEDGYNRGWIGEPATRTLGLVLLAITLLTAGAGLLCALVEGTLVRRRTLVTLVAAGTPRAVLARVVVWQALLPTVPAVALAVAVGAFVPRLVVRDVHTLDGRVVPIPVPWPDLAVLGGAALATVMLAVALSLPALWASTDIEELRTE